MFLKKEFDEQILKAEKQKAAAALERVARETPVKTGKARASWRLERHTVVTDCDYMNDLNRGSSVQAPMYFIEQAILQDVSLKPNGTIVLNK
jgi:hypothetical protein